ncbi:MAG: squalene/phytoene synthase family protein [Verrucomicrobiota bacterium]|nr:squalene/phytoene synthase family protein [Verrucomicrobiota bacterium]
MVAQLRGPILRSVSRSFYLSIRLLPRKLRDPIALAYLLARATDTIADTSEIEASVRTQELARLAALIQGERLPERFENFAAHQTDAAERTLIKSVPLCLEWLRAIASEEQTEIRSVLLRINEGQTLDVQRFADSSRLIALETAADLDRYTYLVAGCVGEFWTNICFLDLPRFSTNTRDEMVSLGVAYGKGLQLINILRDVGGDLRAGRCYLPANELGMHPSQVRERAAELRPVLDRWRARAEQGIAAGVEYSCAIRPWRVRLATALPALIGARTLALLRDAGPKNFDEKVKVPREEVRRILLVMLGRLASPSSVRAMFKSLSS